VRVLRRPARPRGPSGTSQVTGPSVAAAPWSSTPPGVSPPSPSRGDDDCCLQGRQTPGHPGHASFRGRFPHGSAARLPTHQSGCCHPGCKASYRPAGLGFGRTGLSPAGRQTKFTEVSARLPPSGPALPGRTATACSPRRVCSRLQVSQGEQAVPHWGLNHPPNPSHCPPPGQRRTTRATRLYQGNHQTSPKCIMPRKN
jgi:hypothetical protein